MIDKKQLSALFLEKISASGLSIENSKVLGFEPLLTPLNLDINPSFPGFKIPYFTIKGVKTSYYRYRYLVDTRTPFDKLRGDRTVRYKQPKNTSPELYIPPLIDWHRYLKQTADPVIITEGELKSACATLSGFPTVGLGGVWSFKSKNKGVALIPIFEELNIVKRNLIICFDSDVSSNVNVLLAEQELARALTAIGAVVSIARISRPSNSSGTGKLGIDDYIVEYGAEAFYNDVIKKAEAYELCEELHKLNSEVLLVKNPGFIMRLDNGVPMTVAEFSKLHYADRQYIDYRTGDKPKVKSAPQEWIKWRLRASVEGVCYAPGKPLITDDNKINRWHGWGAEPVKGDVSLWHTLTNHLFYGDEEALRYFEKWCAYPLQNPGCKLRTAMVLWGRETGTGKSLVGYTLGRIYGSDNFAELSDIQMSVGNNFNDGESEKQFILIDDLTGVKNRLLANKLKVMITRERILVNKKYTKQYFIEDCGNFLFTSNDPDAVYLDKQDRRFFIHEVRVGRLPQEFYQKFDLWVKSTEGVNALFDYFLELSTEGFDPFSAAPITNSKKNMLSITRSELEDWVARALEEPDHYLRLGGELYTAEELSLAYDPTGVKKTTYMTMARKLKTFGVEPIRDSAGNVQVYSETKGARVTLYPVKRREEWAKSQNLDFAQAHYDEHRRNRGRLAGKF